MIFNPLKQPVTSKVNEKELQERKDFNRACAAMFSTAQGKMVLKYIRSKTIERACSPPGSAEGYGFWREGQNDLVRQIETAIKLGKEGS